MWMRCCNQCVSSDYNRSNSICIISHLHWLQVSNESDVSDHCQLIYL